MFALSDLFSASALPKGFRYVTPPNLQGSIAQRFVNAACANVLSNDSRHFYLVTTRPRCACFKTRSARGRDIQEIDLEKYIIPISPGHRKRRT